MMSIEHLLYKQDALIKDRIRLTTEKQSYQAYLSAKDEVSDALTLLSEKAQFEAISLYSELLSKLVSDVIGKEQEVVLETKKIRDKVNLNIYVIENGNAIEIVEGKGGSVCNLITVGMRVVALIQSPYRRFLFLDEPDCWLSPELVKRFVCILKQLCTDVGLQVVYISHHSESVIGEDVKNIHLTNATGNLLSEIKSIGHESSGFVSKDILNTNDDFGKSWLDGHGINHIRLHNFMSHENTLVSLSQDMTLLTGNNDIGKSSVFRALKALSTNSASERYIKHGETVASVEVALDNNVVIVWAFSSKRSILPCYTIVAGGDEEIIESKQGEVPIAISDILNFGEIGDFDLHFAPQNDPLFILHPNVKGYDRAKFLSLSDEFDIVLKMIDNHKRKIAESRSIVKVLSDQISHVNNQLNTLKPLPLLQELSSSSDYVCFSNQLQQALNWVSSFDRLQIKQSHLNILNDLNCSSLPSKSITADLKSILNQGDQGFSFYIRLLNILFHETNHDFIGGHLKSVLSTFAATKHIEHVDLIKALSVSSEVSFITEKVTHVLSVLERINIEYCKTCGQEINLH